MRLGELIALMPGDGALDVPAGLSVVAVPGWRAILARHRSLGLKPGRKALFRAAKQRQLWLEALLPQGTVLPALPGTKLKPEEIQILTLANATQLERLDHVLSGQVQYQISIRCDAERALQVMARRPGPCAGRTTVEAWEAAFEAHVTEVLHRIPGLHLQALPVAGDLVVNLAVLLPRIEELSLDAALEVIDALWSEGLSIQQVGPSPGVSFASFGLKPIPARALAAASGMLHLPSDATAPQIEAARHAALKRGVAPAEEVRRAADLLTRAAKLPVPGPFPHLFTWAEGQSLPAPLAAKAGAA